MASAFSGKAGRKASIDAEKYIGIFRDELNQNMDAATNRANSNTSRARKDLTGQYGQALNALGQYYDVARNDLQDGAGGAESALTSGYNTANTHFDQAYSDYDRAYGDLDRGYHEYDALADQTGRGAAMYTNALGVNGAGGNAAAVGAFHAGPGYQFQVDQASDEVMRRAGASGMLASGNMMAALGERVRGAADQEYGSWLDRLSGQQQLNAQVTGARAGIRGDQANVRVGQAGVGVTRAAVDQTYGQNLGTVRYNTGAALSGLANGYGQNVATARASLGTALAGNANTNTQLANDIAKTRAAGLLDLGSQQTAAHTSGMMAGQQAAQNRMGAIMGGIGLAGQIAGLGVSGGGSLGGNFLSSLFGK